MASGTFRTPTYNGNAKTRKYIEVAWTSTNNVNNNTSTISWQAHSYGDSGYVYGGPIVVTINGVSTTVVSGSNRRQLYNGTSLGSGSTVVTHNADGTKTVNVSIEANIYIGAASPPNITYSGTITMTPNPVYSLTISEGAGSEVSVNRTMCAGYGSTGELSPGTQKLCSGDILKISFTSDPNYAVDTHTVNGASFISGNAHTVSGNVSIVSTARALASQIGATDANIGSTSTITVTKYNSSHCHSISYSFNGLTGYITSSGGTSPSEEKFTDTGIAFYVPLSFYTVLTNAQSGVCTLTCKTYESLSSSTVVGEETTCTFIASVSSGSSSPTVTGSVVDTNATTAALTGDNTVLVRYKSNARCSMSVSTRNFATVAAKYINNSELTGDSITYSGVSTPTFNFKALDSRGFVGQDTVTPTMIQYIPLTCNPILSRPTPTGNVVALSLTGMMYRGSFREGNSNYNNTLTIRYRYKKSTDVSWGDTWYTISSGISYRATSYYTDTPINLTGDFDYRDSYVFEIEATDGISGITLSKVNPIVSIQKGLPIFDWGEDDFNINGTLKIFGEPVDLSGKTIKYVHQVVTTPYGNFLGDISENDSIGNEDISLLASYVAGTTTPSTSAKSAAADIDGDGQITQDDLDILNWFVVSGIDRTKYTLARYDITYTDGTTGKAYGGVLKTIASAGGGGGGTGEDGGWYTPSVDANGNLSWTPSKSGMPSVSSSNIKGPPGSPGTNGTDGNKWYFGLNIHGTDTTGTIFAGSGIAYANVGDGYVHTSTFNMYRCIVAGASSVAQWVYIGCTKGSSSASTGSKVFYGSSTSLAANETKEATCDSSFVLEQGVVVNIWFQQGQSYDTSGANPLTLNVNNSGAINIECRGSTTPPQYMWRTGEIVSFIYTGSKWQMVRGGIAGTTYYGVTKLSNSVSSSSEDLAATSLAVKTAYDLAVTKTTPAQVNDLIAVYISNLDARGVNY